MNKKDKNKSMAFHSVYENSEMPQLPEELSKENIINILDRKEMPKSKRRKKYAPLKAVLAATLAITVITGSVFIYDGISKGAQLHEDYSSQELQTASDYSEIRKVFNNIKKENHRKKASASLGEIFDKASNDLATTPESSPGAYSEIGKTNVQVEGVDEADIIKNDGKYLYSLANNKISIVNLLPADKMEVIGTIDITDDIKIEEKKADENTHAGETTNKAGNQGSVGAGRSSSPAADTDYPEYYYNNDIYASEFYVYGDTIAVLGKIYDYNSGFGFKTFVNIYDISDKSKVTLKEQFLQDGSYLSSRLIGGDLYILSSCAVNLYWELDDSEEGYIPSSGYSGDVKTVPAKDICIVSEPDEASYLIASGLDLDNLKAGADTKSVLGAGQNAYCNTESLFVARTKYTYTGNLISDAVAVIYSASFYDYLTEIYRFSLDDGKIAFDCKGVVDGTVDDQFSMDEYDGYFRIATTGSDKKGVTSGGVYVLDNKLKTVGKITGLAKGERIYAVRFIGETAYVVTFEQTDPLFVIDLSIPESPTLKGELKITGFSEYLHPVGENLLLGIGKNGDMNGTIPGIKISLFDVSDPKKPIEADKLIIRSNSIQRYISTEAWSSHKAVMVYANENLYGIPVNDYDYSLPSRVFFLTFRVENNKIVRDYSYKVETSNQYFPYYEPANCRGTYIDDTIYVVSQFAVKAYSINDGSLLGETEL
jgi:uncharacterized secreted protein with C-terminal beta-propeller domain